MIIMNLEEIKKIFKNIRQTSCVDNNTNFELEHIFVLLYRCIDYF